MTDTDSSLKERVEQTILNLFADNPTLAVLLPSKPGDDGKPQRPYLSVKAIVGKQIALGGELFSTSVAIDLVFDAKQANEDGPALDLCAQYVWGILTEAQTTATNFGLILNGETQTIEGDTIRRRTINCTVIAG